MGGALVDGYCSPLVTLGIWDSVRGEAEGNKTLVKVRGHWEIGVAYTAMKENASYVPTSLFSRDDVFVFFNQSKALESFVAAVYNAKKEKASYVPTSLSSRDDTYVFFNRI